MHERIGSIVDENLYYRSIKKDEADHSRRDQTHGLPPSQLINVGSLPAPGEPLPTIDAIEGKGTEEKKDQKEGKEADGQTSHVPPFLFRNANGLLNMTRQHNVRLLSSLLSLSHSCFLN